MFILLLLGLGTSARAEIPGQGLDDVVIPAKTEIFVQLSRAINTKTAQAGDRFHGRVEVPITVDDQVVVPPGSYVIGQVILSKRPGRLRRKAELRVRFDTVVLENGITRKVEAVMQSAEHERLKPGDEEGTLEGGGSQVEETVGGAAGGGIAGGTIGGLGTGSWAGAGSGAAVGAAVGALVGVFRRGQHVILDRGSSITIQLEDPVRFVKP